MGQRGRSGTFIRKPREQQGMWNVGKTITHKENLYCTTYVCTCENDISTQADR